LALYSIDQISTIVNYHGISIDSIIGCVGGRLNIALINIGIIASSIEGYVKLLHRIGIDGLQCK